MILLLPADSCPPCKAKGNTTPVHPYCVDTDRHRRSLLAFYFCTGCGTGWSASWALEARELACPGCPACRAVRGAA
jgi:hypothetical protein